MAEGRQENGEKNQGGCGRELCVCFVCVKLCVYSKHVVISFNEKAIIYRFLTLHKVFRHTHPSARSIHTCLQFNSVSQRSSLGVLVSSLLASHICGRT